MVELLPLNQPDDVAYVKQLLEEFVEKTGSLIAQDLLKVWPEPTNRIIKVNFEDKPLRCKDMRFSYLHVFI